MSADNEKIIFKYGDDNAKPFFEHAEFVGAWAIKKMQIKESAKKTKGVTRITLPYKAFPGDLFTVKNSNFEYYIVKWEAFAREGGHIFQIKRLDGYPIIDLDLNILKKKTWLQISGYVNNRKKNQ